MLKKALLFLSALSIGATAGAQTGGFHCVTDEVHKSLKEKFPEIAISEAELERQVKEGLKHLNLGKSSADPSMLDSADFVYNIPIVVHIVHDYSYGSNNQTKEYLTDNVIYNAVKEWNEALGGYNADTSDVIPAFKPYIGNPHIKVHLATKDPNGNPTTGITRHQSYMTQGTGTLAKVGGWPNTSYMNIWVIRNMEAGSQAAAFALKPAAGQQLPWYDGVMTTAQYFSEETFAGSDKTIPHELAHTFNIDHVWGGTNNPNVACGDDNVDDTPPTKGHTQTGCTPASIYDTTCSFGYLKVYASIQYPGIDSLVNYPDTNNSQNIMDYTYCSRMFSKGQAHRMHEALNVNVAGRNNLWSTGNLAATGALDTRPDLAPVTDFFVGNGYGPSNINIPGGRMYFMCANTNDKFSFMDASWRDTIATRTWSFSNNPMNQSILGDTQARANFQTPGWVTTTLTTTSNAGTSTTTKQLVYAADGQNKINPSNGFYYMEFNPGSDLDKWPIFNYYNNDFKWEVVNDAGYYDNSCIRYTGYDTRGIPAAFIGTPEGDLDDLFSPSFNLSGMATGHCNINYMFAGTAMSAFVNDMRDFMSIYYSTDCGKSWVAIDSMTQDDLFNNGNQTTPYKPSWMGEWELKSINIPPAARVDGVFFRFRYRPHTTANGAITSNNFYMDRINITNFPLGANTLITEDRKIVIAPNPTNGSSNVIISGEVGANTEVVVTDITGKLVFKTSEMLTSNYTTVVIPAEVMTAKGIYMVQVRTGAQSHTEKLVVY